MFVRRLFVKCLFVFLVQLAWQPSLIAAQLQLTWADNSANEDGFRIERKTGTSGSYALLTTAGPNATSYSNTGLADGTTYCYRVSAFNTGGTSPYSNESCAATPAAAPTTTVLTVSKSGNGSGTITSSPSGINCGSTCSGTYTIGASVSLTATANAGSVFTGWSGDADCSDGSLAMTTGKSCTATFQLQTYTLSVTLVNTMTAAGTGSGSVTSSPAGINCGADCSETYTHGTAAVLTATPASGSMFTGWSGACSGTGSCSVSMTVARSVTATFAAQSFTLTVNKSGRGAVSSSPYGIDCGDTCSGSYAGGSTMTLTATPDANFSFLGWSGACSGTGSCAVTLSANTSVTASFSSSSVSLIGVFRPGTGEWFVDLNGNGVFDDCNLDRCMGPFGDQGDRPVPAEWTNGQVTLLGVFDTSTAIWYMDQNGNGTMDGCELDTCRYSYGLPGDVPLVGDWTGSGINRIGVYRPSEKKWYFDINGDHDIDSCKVDACTRSFGTTGDIPVVGDWTGSGKTKIGVFRPSTRQWILDVNGNRKMGRRCSGDFCITSFGAPGDVPVVGDWNGNGIDKIGVFRPSTQEWMLDLNGNGVFDGCGVDLCATFGQAGDLPVVGKW